MKNHLNTNQLAHCIAASVCAASNLMGMTALAQTSSSGPIVAATATMPASARLALPGENHRWLEPLVGQWNVEMRVFFAPGQAPLVSKEMTATRSWILGGRYLLEELSGVFAGNPSNRIATLGFNNLDERWELSTIDTFEPGQMVYTGAVRGSANRFELRGESTEAGMGASPTGRKRELRYAFEIMDADKNIQKIYLKYPAQPEMLFVEQIFTRKR
jgi:hypothetical protein